MPADRYQVVLAEGCDAYQIGTAFKENPAEAGKNVDIITTTSFSDAASPAAVQQFVAALIARDSVGRLRPQPVSRLLTQLGGNSWTFKSLYGMHGIDDNPKLVPFRNTERFGTTCSANADCGGPGNLCVRGQRPGQEVHGGVRDARRERLWGGLHVQGRRLRGEQHDLRPRLREALIKAGATAAGAALGLLR